MLQRDDRGPKPRLRQRDQIQTCRGRGDDTLARFRHWPTARAWVQDARGDYRFGLKGRVLQTRGATASPRRNELADKGRLTRSPGRTGGCGGTTATAFFGLGLPPFLRQHFENLAGFVADDVLALGHRPDQSAEYRHPAKGEIGAAIIDSDLLIRLRQRLDARVVADQQ